MAYKGVKISVRRLRALLAADDRSGAMIARAIGVEPRSFSNWLSGQKEVVGIDPEAFQNLVRELRITPDVIKAPSKGVVTALNIDADFAMLVSSAAAEVGEFPEDYIRRLINEDQKRRKAEAKAREEVREAAEAIRQQRADKRVAQGRKSR